MAIEVFRRVPDTDTQAIAQWHQYFIKFLH